MTEDEQIAYAMQMSMQESQQGTDGNHDTAAKTNHPRNYTDAGEGGEAAAAMESATVPEPEVETMEVDEPASDADAFAEMVDDPAFIQAVLEGQNLPAETQQDKDAAEQAKRDGKDGSKSSGNSSGKKPPGSEKSEPKKK